MIEIIKTQTRIAYFIFQCVECKSYVFNNATAACRCVGDKKREVSKELYEQLQKMSIIEGKELIRKHGI